MRYFTTPKRSTYFFLHDSTQTVSSPDHSPTQLVTRAQAPRINRWLAGKGYTDLISTVCPRLKCMKIFFHSPIRLPGALLIAALEKSNLPTRSGYCIYNSGSFNRRYSPPWGGGGGYTLLWLRDMTNFLTLL
jgi:hypothetical protein